MDENTKINQVNYYIDRCVLQYFNREIIVFIFTRARSLYFAPFR